MTKKPTPEQILDRVYKSAELTRKESVIDNDSIRNKVDYVCRNMSNRSCVRLLMACLLGKLDNPKVDLRKPYTEIGTADSFSGRTYDEQDITGFIHKYRLPLNSTTAFLTPTLRNINHPLSTKQELVGRPRALYVSTLQLLEDVAKNRIDAEALFIEIVRDLLNLRDENIGRIESLLKSIKGSEGSLPLSSEGIVTLIGQHLACKNSSRLPVLIVAAAYRVVGKCFNEYVLPLKAHNAADFQTGSVGDVEICLVGEKSIVTAYEMKMKIVSCDDIDQAVTKIAKAPKRIDNYLFVTTEAIDPTVIAYATKYYEETGGTEIAILDCMGFLRHFLHFFHRARKYYLNAYQALVMREPDSAVSQTLKEAFLALRKAAESGE